MRHSSSHFRIRYPLVSAYRVPTDQLEADGTYAWDATTLVLVTLEGEGQTGIGYTYADLATAQVIQDMLFPIVQEYSTMDISGAWQAMVQTIRDLGRPGIASMAIAAVDIALWDLKARLLHLPLATLLGMAHESALLYGSGGFTTYSLEDLQTQLGGWVEQWIPGVKMKIGTHPAEDLVLVHAVREAIGDQAELYVDANGAYDRKEALKFAEALVELGVV